MVSQWWASIKINDVILKADGCKSWKKNSKISGANLKDFLCQYDYMGKIRTDNLINKWWSSIQMVVFHDISSETPLISPTFKNERWLFIQTALKRNANFQKN